MNFQRLILPLAQFIERFSFWGLQSTLVLLLIYYYHFNEVNAINLFGIFTALSFGLSIIGGLIADKFLNIKHTISIGLLFAIIGNFLIAIGIKYLIFPGLFAIAIGAGLFIPNNPNLLAALYSHLDLRKITGITQLYAGENFSCILGPCAYGILSSIINMQACFMLSAIALSIYLFVFEKFKNSLPNIQTFFIEPAGLNQNPANILKLAIILLLASVYFINIFQLNSSLVILIDHYTNRNILDHQVPTSIFFSLESGFAISLAPLFIICLNYLSKKNIKLDELVILAFSLIVQGYAFHIFITGIQYAISSNMYIPITKMILGYLLLGLADICLMPTIINAITTLATPRYKGIYMGAFYLFIGTCAFLASKIAAFMTSAQSNKLFIYLNIYKDILNLTWLVSLLALLTYLIKFNINNSTEESNADINSM